MEFLSEIIQRDRFLIDNGFHNRDSIIIVLEGSFRCSTQEETFTATAGDICIFHAKEPFRRKVIQPLRCVYLQFEPFPCHLPTGLLKTTDPVRTENTVSHLAQAVEHENRELTEHFIRDILLMHRYLRREESDKTVSKCIRYLSRHYQEPINLEMVASHCFMSRQGLIRKFKAYTGRTPMEYLSGIRLSQSKLLLKDSSLSIGEIATRCGYKNVYYFSNHFKKATGTSPSEYRRLMAL